MFLKYGACVTLRVNKIPYSICILVALSVTLCTMDLIKDVFLPVCNVE